MNQSNSSERSPEEILASAPRANPKRIDALKNIAGEDGDSFVRELIEAFDEDSRTRIKLLEEAVSRQDCQALYEIAHTLKGSCTNIGAEALAELSLVIEIRSRDGVIDGIQKIIATMPEALDETLSAIKNLTQ